MPQFLTHQGCAQPVGPVEQPAQGRLDAALALPRRQVQDLQILPGRLLRLLLPQAVVGQPEAARREQVVAVAVVGERPRLAHQPVDDVPVLDAVLAPATQPRQPFDLLLRVPHLQVVGVDADLDPLADQPADHRVGVAADVDGAATIDAHRHSLAGVQTLRRQRPQHGCLLLEAPEPAPVALGEQRTHERRVVGAAGEVATAAQQQGLVEGALEPVVALLDVAVLVRPRRVDGLAAQPVVLQQRLVALLEDVAVAARRHGGGQRVGAMDLGHAAQLGQGVLQAGAEALEALSEADRAGLPVGVGQHEVVDQVRERLAVDGNAQAGAMGEVRRTQSAGLMHLGEEHLLGRPVLGPPLLDAPLQGAELAVGEPARVLALQPGEQGLAFEARVEGELLLDLGPDVGEGVGAGSPVMPHTHLAGQPAKPAIFACRLVVEAGAGGGLALGTPLLIEAAQSANLPIRDHSRTSLLGRDSARLRYAAAREI